MRCGLNAMTPRRRMQEIRQVQKFPPFGTELAARLRSDQPPWLVIVCIGQESWRRAKHWQKNPSVWALVMPASQSAFGYVWQVAALCVLIDWDRGPTHLQIIELVKVLLLSGAEQVTVRPCWVDVRQPAFEYDASRPVGERWVQVREQIVTYVRCPKTGRAKSV